MHLFYQLNILSSLQSLVRADADAARERRGCRASEERTAVAERMRSSLRILSGCGAECGYGAAADQMGRGCGAGADRMRCGCAEECGWGAGAERLGSGC